MSNHPPRTRVWRRSFAMKKIDPEESDNTPLFGNVTVENHTEGYVTVRDADRNFVSYAHGKEVMRGDEWGLPPPSQIPEAPPRSASQRQFHQVKQSVTESAKSLTSIFERVNLPGPVAKLKKNGKEAKGPVVYEHNPRVVYGHPPSKMEKFVGNSKTLTNLVSSVKMLNIMPKPKVVLHRDWDSRGKEPVYLTENQFAEIDQWNEDSITEYNEHGLVALTTRQLKELQGESADIITYSTPTYMVPPSTPTGSDAGSIFEEEEGDIFGRPEDDDPNAEHKYLHKDLRKLLGPYTGFHIAPTIGSTELFDEFNNRSDYYNMPLIERGRDPKKDMTIFVNMIDQEYEEGGEAKGYDSEDEDVDSDASSNYDQTQNVLQRPRSQLVGQAIIQYLLFKGLPLNTVATMLRSVDKKFLHQSESRWWKGYRVPQHTQLTDKIVEKILEVAKADKEWWEEDKDRQGRQIPNDMRIIQFRMRERSVKTLAKKSVENYFWWRLRGEQHNRDVKSGPMMRMGEY